MIYYVEDSDTRFFRVESGKMTEAALDAIAETVFLNKIGVFVTEVCLQRANFPSKTHSSYCDIPVSPDYLREDNNVIANVQALTEAGIDANSYLLEKVRRKGVQGWVSIRMNDIHAGEDPDSPLHTEFWRSHPEYRISNVPYENSLDFSHEEVRNHMLDFIEEVINRYDVEGIILDWMRFPTYFRHREAWLKHDLLTEVQAKAAAMVREKEKRTGKKIVLAARVPLSPLTAKSIGLDVETWAENDLVDRIFISGFAHTQSYNPPVQEWKKIVDIPVTVSLEGWHRPHISARAIGMEGEALRGAASTALSNGSDGILIYNMMEINCKNVPGAEDLSQMPDTYCDCPSADRNCLEQLDDLAKLVKLPRKYYLAWRDMDLTIAEQDRALRLQEPPALTFELPCLIPPGMSHEFYFYTGPVNEAVVVPEIESDHPEAPEITIQSSSDSVTLTVRNNFSVPLRIESAAVRLFLSVSLT